MPSKTKPESRDLVKPNIARLRRCKRMGWKYNRTKNTFSKNGVTGFFAERGFIKI